MGKGDFGVPIRRLPKITEFDDPNILWDKDSNYLGRMSDRIPDDLIDRFVSCINALDGIPDPEKTVPKLVDCINGLDELYGALMVEATELSSEVHKKLIAAQKALEGVSGE
ncbi:hypothetical protein LCGC14_0452300 [marine sediment metagenome]|uniref:Uncharacterized protein n=1 Tax=marine sediment metagenome TaxID=412755 RepID=A0A0F9SMY3_9ZZZZ